MYKNVNVTIPIKRELMMNFIEKGSCPQTPPPSLDHIQFCPTMYMCLY